MARRVEGERERKFLQSGKWDRSVTRLHPSFPQKTNIQQLKEEIREKLPETTAEANGGTSITGTNSTTTGTLRHRKNRPAPQPPQRPSSHNGAISAPEQLEIRAPSELLFGVPSTLKTQWRHQPKALVTGCVMYVANVSIIVFLWLVIGASSTPNIFGQMFFDTWTIHGNIWLFHHGSEGLGMDFYWGMLKWDRLGKEFNNFE